MGVEELSAAAANGGVGRRDNRPLRPPIFVTKRRTMAQVHSIAHESWYSDALPGLTELYNAILKMR